MAEKIKAYVPNFVIKVEDYLKDDQRDYRVENDKIEATGLSALKVLMILPQVLKGYKVLLEVSDYMMT